MNEVNPFEVPISLIGHPFAPIGKGADMRGCYRSFKAVGIRPHVVNVYEGVPHDRELEVEFAADVRRTSAGGIDIFCINGDEVEPVLSHLGSRRAPAHFSVVVPFWELSKYPASWARQLERFDEVWVASSFTRDAIEPEVARQVTVIPSSIGFTLGHSASRRYFGIPESSYAFLFAFDLRSFHERKNPLAVVEAFVEVSRARPTRDLALVVKMSGASARPEDARVIRERFAAFRSSSRTSLTAKPKISCAAVIASSHCIGPRGLGAFWPRRCCSAGPSSELRIQATRIS
jgi:hypothetical protein